MYILDLCSNLTQISSNIYVNIKFLQDENKKFEMQN